MISDWLRFFHTIPTYLDSVNDSICIREIAQVEGDLGVGNRLRFGNCDQTKWTIHYKTDSNVHAEHKTPCFDSKQFLPPLHFADKITSQSDACNYHQFVLEFYNNSKRDTNLL